MVAQSIAAIINNGMYRPQKAVQPKDFMPSQWQTIKARVPTERTPEQQQQLADAFRAWAGVRPA